MKNIIQRFIPAAAMLALLAGVSAAQAIDADAANALAKKNDCFKCHALDRDKKGPSYKKIAEKHAGKPDAQAKLITNFTTAPKVKLDDGTEEEHKVIKLDPKKPEDLAQMKNLADWILSIK